MTQTETNRPYRATFILDTRSVGDEIDTTVDKLADAVRESGGEVGEIYNLGRKDFARVTVRGHSADYFIQVEFDGPAAAPAALGGHFRLDKTVKRVLVQSR